MKYYRSRTVTSAPYEKYKHLWPQCDLCGEKKMGVFTTIDKVHVCYECFSKDTESEFVDSER